MLEKQQDLKKETKKRIARAKKEFDHEPDMKEFENTEGYHGIVAQVGIKCTGKCEHHHLEFKGDVSIAYVPGDTLVGLSKMARVAEYYMNPLLPSLQERITQQILNHLVKTLNPRGVMVVVKARHGCIADRGVKKDSLTITSSVQGIFETDNGARNEFLQLVNSNGPHYF